jgi:cellulose synthase/poly-beta-1,6-N-acetylglucosamine synthase-like glycosyltransferase
VPFYEIILTGYLFLGCLYWFWMAVGAVRVVRAVPRLVEQASSLLEQRQAGSLPYEVPKLSVIIPACNEADTIGDAVKTVLAQDYPDLEIILVDDRSTDGTDKIIDAVAAADPRVRPLHVAELPDGWLGKVHALHAGVAEANGDWLLFTDADVHLSPGVLRRAVAYAEHCQIDHLAAAPDIWCRGVLLSSVIAMFLRSFCIGMRCWGVENPKSSSAIGVGAFNLVRRAAFVETDGFEWLRLEVADDVGLGMMMKRSGFRSCLVNASRLVGVHWYRNLREMARGAEKGYASIGHCSVVRMLLVTVVSVAMELAPLAAFVPVGHRGMLPAGAAMLAAGVFSNVLMLRWARRPIWPGLLFPLAAVVGATLLLRTTWLGWRRGGCLWRGTLYPSKLLRPALRVRFP